MDDAGRVSRSASREGPGGRLRSALFIPCRAPTRRSSFRSSTRFDGARRPINREGPQDADRRSRGHRVPSRTRSDHPWGARKMHGVLLVSRLSFKLQPEVYADPSVNFALDRILDIKDVEDLIEAVDNIRWQAGKPFLL